MASTASPGKSMAATLHDSLLASRIGAAAGDHARQIIAGVTPDGSFVDGMTVDAFVHQAGQVLLDSGRVYRYGNSIVQETDRPGDQRLTSLAVQHRAEPNAAHVLTNHFGIAYQGKQGDVQSLLTPKLVGALLADEGLWRHLPEIRYHTRLPTFDADFNLCWQGWNSASGILVHGPEIVPETTPSSYAPDARAVDRLPHRLRGLFREFYWRSDADMVNAIAMLLTGLLGNHFVDAPHPGGIVDANQPELGKTLLVQCIGRVLDDAEPPRISLARDEELEKRLCAQLRSSKTSLFFFDNVRTRIESAVIEQNMLSPLISLRILGLSATIERPNTYLWFITSNLTAGTPDFIGRCVPIRLHYEGDPKGRMFSGDPLAYAAEHRLPILAELAGMVLRWAQQGRRPGDHKHRCRRWAATIGGILDAGGLGEFFLANAAEAGAAMDEGMQDLATLAEHAVGKNLADTHGLAERDPAPRGRTPGEWVVLFAETQVLKDRLAVGTVRGRATVVGIFLSDKVGRTVTIETADGTREATLRRRDESGNTKFYYFSIAFQKSAVPGSASSAASAAASHGAAVPAPAAAGGAAPTAASPPPADAASIGEPAPPTTEDLEWI
ncbi:hypothetical protein [Paludisphaera mucosa]|uniref:ATPase AAA-type core domain-containing protein n=1 Tax=Paludisphaera mucosa TaxID=3030827 RepID=A0ABT6FE96_9BACT|nr:hypothetical protein [Paludisphaera mucosa]MDG3005903.1 hypothetical protein [Paludisphaera mucosa]